MKTTKFKVGDRVKVVATAEQLEENDCPVGMLGLEGVIAELADEETASTYGCMEYRVVTDRKVAYDAEDISRGIASNNWWVLERHLEPASEVSTPAAVPSTRYFQTVVSHAYLKHESGDWCSLHFVDGSSVPQGAWLPNVEEDVALGRRRELTEAEAKAIGA